MRRGLFPGQEEAIRERLAELHSARECAGRRAFLGILAGGAVGAASATVVTSSWVSADTSQDAGATVVAESAPRLARQRGVATGPIDDLLDRQAQFVTSVMLTETSPDDAVWVGITRLIGTCVDRHPRAEPGLAALLLQLTARHHFPRHLHHWVAMLQQLQR